MTLSLEQGVTTPATTRVEIAATLTGRSATASLSLPGNKALTFPTSASLQIDSGAGAMSVTATAYDAQGAVIDRAMGTVDVAADKTVPLSLTLGGNTIAGDMLGHGDLAGDGGVLTGAPSAPTSVVASSGNAQATIIWDAPASLGTSAITSYTVVSSPGGIRVTTPDGNTMTATVAGLINGTTYTFAVAAENAAGTGPAASSNPVTPTATPMVPSAPMSIVAVANVDHAATVSWIPADNHGSPLQGYAVSSSQLQSMGTLATAGPNANSVVVTGLTLGTVYNFTVTATNGIGTSVPSFPSNNITAATKPDAPPTGVTAVANVDHGATISWTAPATSGFSPIISYTVTASPGGASATTANGTTTTVVVTGLTPGTKYTFTAFATNIIGNGPASSASSAVTAVGKLPAPTSVFACGADGQIVVSFKTVAGAQSYDVFYNTAAPATAGSKVNVAASPATVTLSNGNYHLAVAAVNIVGDGTASSDVTALADSQVHDSLFVSTTSGIDIFDCFSQLPDGTAQPSRSITVSGGELSLAVDPGNAALFADVGGCCAGDTIQIWLDATTINGAASPTYLAQYDFNLTGGGIGPIAVDATHHKLYAGRVDNVGSSPIYRYGYSALSDLNGTLSPEATFNQNGSMPIALVADSASGDLWAVGGGYVDYLPAANLGIGATDTTFWPTVTGSTTASFSGVAYVPAGGGTAYLSDGVAIWDVPNITSQTSGVALTPTTSVATAAGFGVATGNGLLVGVVSNTDVAAWSLSNLSGGVVKTVSSPTGHSSNGAIVYVP